MSLLASVDTFYVLDFDRCIGDTTKFQLALEQAVAMVTSISSDAIHLARHNTEVSGGSFDTARFVIDELAITQSNVEWQTICDEMIRSTKGRDMLEPHAAELLHILKERGEAYGILTYGGQEWQHLKLASSGVGDVPFLITPELNKGLTLASWRQADGTFIIPREMTGHDPVQAKSLVFIDDKAVSFENIPDGVSGIRVVWPDRAAFASQGGAVPAGVKTAQGMSGVIDLLFSPDSVIKVDKT